MKTAEGSDAVFRTLVGEGLGYPSPFLFEQRARPSRVGARYFPRNPFRSVKIPRRCGDSRALHRQRSAVPLDRQPLDARNRASHRELIWQPICVGEQQPCVFWPSDVSTRLPSRPRRLRRRCGQWINLLGNAQKLNVCRIASHVRSPDGACRVGQTHTLLAARIVAREILDPWPP